MIKGALKDCEIPEELAPTWYPVGIEASDPKILSDKLSDTVHIFFSDGDKLFQSKHHPLPVNILFEYTHL